MALDVWYRSDIQNALSAAEQASEAALRAAGNAGDPFVVGYASGYRAALATLALAFGLLPAVSQPQGGRSFSSEIPSLAGSPVAAGAEVRWEVSVPGRNSRQALLETGFEPGAHDDGGEEA